MPEVREPVYQLAPRQLVSSRIHLFFAKSFSLHGVEKTTVVFFGIAFLGRIFRERCSPILQKTAFRVPLVGRLVCYGAPGLLACSNAVSESDLIIFPSLGLMRSPGWTHFYAQHQSPPRVFFTTGLLVCVLRFLTSCL